MGLLRGGVRAAAAVGARMSAAYATTLRVTTDDRPTVPIGWDALAAALREVQGGTEVLLSDALSRVPKSASGQSRAIAPVDTAAASGL